MLHQQFSSQGLRLQFGKISWFGKIWVWDLCSTNYDNDGHL